MSHEQITERGGRAILSFTDPEGQKLELVDDTKLDADTGVQPSISWVKSPVAAQWAIRGLGGAMLTVKNLKPTAALLTVEGLASDT